MASVRVQFWHYDKRNDGTSPVKVYVNAHKKKRYYPTGIYLLPKDWDDKKRQVKTSHPMHQVYNRKIQELRMALEQHFLNGGTHECWQSEDGKSQKASMIQYLENLTIQIMEGKIAQIQPSTGKAYKSLLKRLHQYCKWKNRKDLTFDEVTLAFYNDFRDFLFDHCDCGQGGFAKHVRVLKSMMNRSLAAGLHQNTTHRRKEFHRPRTKSNKIYLTKEEIAAIEKLDLSYSTAMDRERDRFLVSYYLLLRISDTRLIRREHFFMENHQRYLRLIHQKTGTEAIIPVKPKAWELLNKHDFNFTFTTDQHSNRSLKQIAAMAGINQVVKQGEESKPKCQFVTNHTARRSAATNLYLQQVPMKTIADLGGWTDVESLMVYLRASGMQSAKMVRNIDFFK